MALKTRNFIMPLHRRDTRRIHVAKIAVFFAPPGGLCYISCGKKGFGAPVLELIERLGRRFAGFAKTCSKPKLKG
jgi:hypothetical protein